MNLPKIPLPEKSRIILMRGDIAVVPSHLNSLAYKYAERPVILVRYIIGKDYRGLQLPKGTQEIHSITLLDLSFRPDGPFYKSCGQVVRYVRVSHLTPYGIWDRFVGYDENGYGLYELNGNVGRMIADEKIRKPTEDEKREIESLFMRTRRVEVFPPTFHDIKIEEYPAGQEIDLRELLGIRE